MSEIPLSRRTQVLLRDKGRCVRCNGRGTDWHHRRSRLVRDDHQHCTCVGVLLCRTCHSWVHANPMPARREGWIVSKFERQPWTVPVVLADGRQRWTDCHAKLEFNFPSDPEEELEESD